MSLSASRWNDTHVSRASCSHNNPQRPAITLLDDEAHRPQLAGTSADQINWPITLLMRHAKKKKKEKKTKNATDHVHLARCNLEVRPDVKTRSLRLLNYSSSSLCKWRVMEI